MSFTFARHFSTDVLVLGAGLAGLRAAHTAAGAGTQVLLACKTQLCGGASFYPMMDTLGCQCPGEAPEDADWFLQEIAASSLGMHDEWMNRYYIENIRRRLAEAPEIGVHPAPLGEEKLACFAQRPRDIFYWGGWDSIRTEARGRIADAENITLWEHAEALCLLKAAGGGVCGAVLRLGDGALALVDCGAVVLCTGGYGGLYKHNLNTPDVAGAGQALALDAGASLVNLEFQQFIPGFITPLYKTILREGTLDHVTAMTDADGNDVLRRHLPKDEDYFTCLHQRATHGPFTSVGIAKYFDIALMDAVTRDEENPGVRLHYAPALLEDTRKPIRLHLDWLRRDFGIDVMAQPIWVAPFFHAANGGVLVDHTCSATVPGLYAAGEVAGGIHGADRHGGNATGSCFVFGHLAGQSAAAYAKGAARFAIHEQAAAEQLGRFYTPGPAKGPTPSDAAQTVRDSMWSKANVVRHEGELTAALDTLQALAASYRPGTHLQGGHAAGAATTRSLLLLGQAVLQSMLARQESRGSHYRADYPRQDDSAFLQRGVVRLKDGKPDHSFIPTAQ